MKYLQEPVQYGSFQGVKYTPIDTATNYNSVVVMEVPEDKIQTEETENTKTLRKVAFFELINGKEIVTKVPIRATKRRNPKDGDFFVFEDVIKQMTYQSPTIEDPLCVARLEAYLLSNSI